MGDLAAQEVLAMWSDNSQSAFSIYLTLTFAYLTAAYFVGAKLSTFQALAVSGLYSAGAAIALLSCINQLFFFSAIMQEYPDLAATSVASGEFWIYYIGPLLAVGIFVSLYFMWDIRHPKDD